MRVWFLDIYGLMRPHLLLGIVLFDILTKKKLFLANVYQLHVPIRPTAGSVQKLGTVTTGGHKWMQSSPFTRSNRFTGTDNVLITLFINRHTSPATDNMSRRRQMHS